RLPCAKIQGFYSFSRPKRVMRGRHSSTQESRCSKFWVASIYCLAAIAIVPSQNRGAAGFRQAANEADQRIALGIACGAYRIVVARNTDLGPRPPESEST